MSPPFRLLAPRPRSIQRDIFDLVLADGRSISVLRVRDPRARRIKLSVDERGARLTLPARASLATAERFAREHREWLAGQLDRLERDMPAGLQRNETASLPLRGVEVPLRWAHGRFTRLVSGDGELVLSLPAQAGPAAISRALHDFYASQARADVGRWLPGYLPGLPRAPRRIRFKSMSSQWGSLAPDGTVALDLSLVLARPAAFEYVLVHELCHLLHHDHSPAFWEAVEDRCPAWRAERDYFRAEGRRLKGTLRALLQPPGAA